MQTRITSEHAEALAQAFWDRHPDLFYKPQYLRFSDWLTIHPHQLLPEPITQTEVQAWIAQFLQSQNVVPTRFNLRLVMQWVKEDAPVIPNTLRYNLPRIVPKPPRFNPETSFAFVRSGCIESCDNPLCEFGECNPLSEFYTGDKEEGECQ